MRVAEVCEKSERKPCSLPITPASSPTTSARSELDPPPGTSAVCRISGDTTVPGASFAYRAAGARSIGRASAEPTVRLRSSGTAKAAWSCAPRASVARYVPAKTTRATVAQRNAIAARGRSGRRSTPLKASRPTSERAGTRRNSSGAIRAATSPPQSTARIGNSASRGSDRTPRSSALAAPRDAASAITQSVATMIPSSALGRLPGSRGSRQRRPIAATSQAAAATPSTVVARPFARAPSSSARAPMCSTRPSSAVAAKAAASPITAPAITGQSASATVKSSLTDCVAPRRSSRSSTDWWLRRRPSAASAQNASNRATPSPPTSSSRREAASLRSAAALSSRSAAVNVMYRLASVSVAVATRSSSGASVSRRSAAVSTCTTQPCVRWNSSSAVIPRIAATLGPNSTARAEPGSNAPLRSAR